MGEGGGDTHVDSLISQINPGDQWGDRSQQARPQIPNCIFYIPLNFDQPICINVEFP